ncbi:MAG: tRNA preQ1(34) S-adenosylmethionine ribosyltransferase-isomerase QueA [Treponemataceae bacterium]|nr:tRNA preQ1(34) S-adenosylmethionine ribosyltransferase-isomerase QueA [Treponemataceae bacterium]
MKRTDFYFDLPQELIAQYPSERRGNDRLMVLGRKSGEVSHRAMSDLPNFIESGTLMVFNNSRVRKARVFGTKESTGREVEFIFLNKVDDESCVWNTLVKGAKKQKPGMRYEFPDSSVGTILENPQNEGTEFRTVKFDFALTENWFEKNGHIPLPPYIRRADDEADSERYQNVFADNIGSTACPTAGLHFTNEMLETLERKKIERAFITLHVGLGTFLPVREDNIEDHKMHEEIFTVESDAARKINQAKKEGRPILAVGTTSVRTLESACVEEGGAWRVREGTFATSIFMYPGYKFKIVDQMFTNFHTPESTLIMLVSAFSSRENILNAYEEAVREKYRFFSYGDAMLIK